MKSEAIQLKMVQPREAKTQDELTLDEVYLQNKRMIENGRRKEALAKAQAQAEIEANPKKKDSFFKRFIREADMLFFG